MPSAKPKVLLEMSGGLDSSVAALLLKEQGYDVIGVMMKLWNSKSFNKDYECAKKISKQLNIQFQVIDLQEKFNNEVVNYFINTYKQAKTPNPCVVCNMLIKFGEVFNIAKNLKCEKIATGHYAQIIYENDTYSLHRAIDLNKDQSYVLHFLNQEMLKKIVFPLGKYSKDDIREKARQANLPCAEKEESMDICFIENESYAEFILNNSNYIPKPGNVVDANSNVLGQHKGLINYTIGQRKGLGLAFNEPMYVLSLDKNKNEVILGTKQETFTKEVYVNNFSWIAGSAPANKFSCEAKLRYRQQPHKCEAVVEKDFVKLIYENGISAVTPGQFAVLYDGNKVLGGGRIQ